MKRITLILMLLLTASTTFSIIFHSCEKESVEFSENDTQLLSIKGSLSDANSLTTEDYSIISTAITRMGVKDDNGKIATNGLPAERLGISQDLYDQLTFAFDKANGSFKKARVRKKANGEDIPSGKDKIDCVPALFSEVLGLFGKPQSLEEIKDWCKSKNYYVATKGVRPETIDTIMHHYLKAEYRDISAIKPGYKIQDGEISSMGCLIIVVKISETEGHVLRVRSVTSALGGTPVYWCSNPQDGPGTTPYIQSQIMSSYYISGAADF